MLFTDIDILDENLDYQAHQWVGVKDGAIDYIGDAAPENAADYGEVYDGCGRLLMPALYNAHTHLPMTLLRGYAENVPLREWLNNLVWPFEGKMTPEDNYWATKLALAEMARYGSVSASDMYYATDERVQAVCEAHMKMNVCESVLYFEPKPFAEYPMCEKMERIVKQYHGAQDGRIRVDYNIHAEYTSNPITCTDIGKVAKEAGLPIHIHISETKSEHEECKGRHDGLTPVQYFESIGVFDVPVIAAHCVWVVERMAHMKLAGHVRRRNRHRAIAHAGVAAIVIAGEPFVEHALLDGFCVVILRHVFHWMQAPSMKRKRTGAETPRGAPAKGAPGKVQFRKRERSRGPFPP